jgi:2-amino-4-hydroxy-6-hydroxymethyldihydropteridine diphosphokinase
MTEINSTRAIVAIGTNVPFNGLAGPALVAAEGLATRTISACHTTVAWPDPADPPFTNAVAVLDAPGMTAQAVLDILLRTEAAFGRVRAARNAPRTLDLDLLDFNGERHNAAGLVLPHPRLQARAFVLGPLMEVLPDWRHPVTGRSVKEMWAALSKQA